jgi:hypothetical protein
MPKEEDEEAIRAFRQKVDSLDQNLILSEYQKEGRAC